MSTPKAYIIGSIFLPADSVDTKALEKALHVRQNREDKATAPVKETYMYYYEEIAGVEYIAIPRVYGEQFLDDFDVVDWSAEGDIGCLSDLTEVKLRPHQPPFVDNVLPLILQDYDLTASAYTGSGKTVLCVEIARRINTSTLIIVDQTKLALQWVDTLVNLFGLPEDQIGHYSGHSKDYEGKPVCIATIQTLYLARDRLDEFYDTWGFTIIDEHHSAGAQKYGTVLMNLSSKYRLGVSATADRRDVFQKVLDYNLGEVAYTLPNNHVASEVRYVEYPGVLSSYANTATQAGTYESEISEDGARNLLIANIVKKMYDEGRDILVISARAVQLHSLVALCEYLGIPEEDMGVYSQSLYQVGYSKDKEPKFRLDEWDNECFYTSVKYGVSNVRSGKVRKETQDKALKAKVIFSTYHMFSKGVDVPRLSIGIDATPRSKVIQAHGRILRTMEGKPTPIWITLRDFNNVRSENQFLRRLDEYSKSNANEVKQWDLQKGLRTIDVTQLKREVQQNLRRLEQTPIVRNKDGTNQLSTVRGQERRRG